MHNNQNHEMCSKRGKIFNNNSIKNKSKSPLAQKISNSTLSNPIYNNVKQL